MTADSTARPAPPTPDDLAGQLGPAAGLWILLRDRILSRDPRITERWVYGGLKYGWSCRLEQGRKGVLYLIPDGGYFRIGLALSDDGRAAVMAGDLPTTVREELAAATRTMEGWPVRLPVRTSSDLDVALRLAEIKLAT
jgi:hypothetical protein